MKEVTITAPTDDEPARTSTPDDQGHTKKALTTWPDHAILRVLERFYDPSYGTPKAGSANVGFINQNEWENQSIDAIKGTHEPLFPWTNAYDYWIPQDPGKHDVEFK